MKSLLVFEQSSEPAPLRQRYQQSTGHCLRIADILVIDEEEGEFLHPTAMDERRPRLSGFTSLNLHRASPRRIVARLLAAMRKAKQQRTRLLNEKGEKNFDKASPSATFSGDGCDDFNHDRLVLRSRAKESGLCRNDTSFNLRVGCSLLYLIAVSKNELNKMVELRTEMEMLLQNAKEELQSRNAFLEPSKKNHTISCSTTDITEGTSSISQLSINYDPSQCLPGPESHLGDEQSMKHETFRVNTLKGIEDLEAELEAELECLQSQLDGESVFCNTQAMAIDVSLPKVNNRSSNKVIRPEEAKPEMGCGVCPVELERRLHELLEVKQQERIKELESALEYAEMELLQKNIELNDIAMLMSRQVPESHHLSSKIKLDME